MTDDTPDVVGDKSSPILAPWLIATVVLVALALLIVLVAVGLKRDSIDITGICTVLSTLISGIVVGVLLKGRDQK